MDRKTASIVVSQTVKLFRFHQMHDAADCLGYAAGQFVVYELLEVNL